MPSVRLEDGDVREVANRLTHSILGEYFSRLRFETSSYFFRK